MRILIYYISIGLIILLQYCYCQRKIYQCTFNSDDCGFISDLNSLQLDTELPPIPDAQPPTRPLSDVTSILEATTYNNESCDLPYEYPQGDWMMHFCSRTSNTSDAAFICPTKTGFGICASGLYGFVITNGSGIYNQSFSREISNAVVGLQCLEFYYYLLNDDYSPTITFKWGSLLPNENATIITQVKPQGENRWYRSRTTFNTTYQDYLLDFQFDREISSPSYTFALDEISITEGPCESISIDTTLNNLVTTQPPTGVNTVSSTNIPPLPSNSSISTTIFLTEESTKSSISTTSSQTTTSDRSSETPPTDVNTVSSTNTPILSNDNQNMGLILGLSLGIGVPVLIVIMTSILYYSKKTRAKRQVGVTHDTNDYPLIETNNK